MLAEIIIGVIRVAQVKDQLKTAKIQRQMTLLNEGTKYLERTGGDAKISNFVTEYQKTKDLMRGESIWE